MPRLLVITAATVAAVAAVVLWRWLARWARWSGVSPDKQARIRADEARRAGLACAAPVR